MSYYVGNFENAPFVQMPAPEERILRCFISPELDPTNQDIALGMTEMQPGCKLTGGVMQKAKCLSVLRVKDTCELKMRLLN